MERAGEIASALSRAVERTAGDPKQAEQAKMAQAMVIVFNAFVAGGFEDLPLEAVETSGLTAELDLNSEWQRQVAKRIEFKFHAELGLTEEEYLASLPKFEPQPEGYLGRFDAPRVVETRIPWERQAELVGINISDYLRERIAQTVPRDKRSQTPKGPYTGWFNKWGQRFEDKIAPDDAVKQLKRDEVGGSPFEAIADHLADPGLNESGRYRDIIGFRVESDYVPYLRRWDDRPRFNALWGGHAYDHFRPLVRGSKIVIR